MSITCPNIEEIIKLKSRTTRFFDEFGDEFSNPEEALDIDMQAMDILNFALSDGVPFKTTAHEIRTGHGPNELEMGERLILSRFNALGYDVSRELMVRLCLFIKLPYQSSLIVGYLAHTFSACLPNNERFVNWEWASSVFNGKYPSQEVFGEFWKKQILAPPYRANMLDYGFVYELLTPEESKYLEEHPDIENSPLQ